MCNPQTTLTLADFLLARIAEDEQRIYACDSDGEFRAARLTFRYRDGRLHYTTVAADHRDDVWCADGTGYQSDTYLDVGEPFFDARRALAECEAKRRIVKDHQSLYPPGAPTPPARTLKYLAVVYADHPDYRDEWRSS